MLDFLGSIGSAIMTPLYYAVSGILLAWHELFIWIGLDPAGGWSWALAIVGLTVTIRALLIPLFVRQIKSSRNMQLLQPQMQELRKKYGHDRERLAQEQMKLWQDTGTNPFASCMPLILQMPVFFALFRVIDQASKKGAEGAKGFMSGVQADQLRGADLLGGRIADTLIGAEHLETRILAIVLVLGMVATQFITQRQLMSKNMPPEALTGPYAQQQKMLLYVLPIVFAVGGIAFPIGVLIYWNTSYLWTMGQQFYVIRRNPAPGSPAFAEKQDRDKKKGKAVTADPTEPQPGEKSTGGQPRQQPKKQSRDQRTQGKGGPRPNQNNPQGNGQGKNQGKPNKNKKKK